MYVCQYIYIYICNMICHIVWSLKLIWYSSIQWIILCHRGGAADLCGGAPGGEKDGKSDCCLHSGWMLGKTSISFQQLKQSIQLKCVALIFWIWMLGLANRFPTCFGSYVDVSNLMLLAKRTETCWNGSKMAELWGIKKLWTSYLLYFFEIMKIDHGDFWGWLMAWVYMGVTTILGI